MGRMLKLGRIHHVDRHESVDGSTGLRATSWGSASLLGLDMLARRLRVQLIIGGPNRAVAR